MKRWGGIVWVLVLVLAGCQSGPGSQPATAGASAPTATFTLLAPAATVTPTVPPATPTATPVGWGTVSIVQSDLYRDNFGDYQITGLLFNGTAQGIAKIKLEVRASDKNGRSVVTNQIAEVVEVAEVAPLLERVAPNSYAPFAVVINAGVPVTYSVAVKSYQPDKKPFATVQLENAQLWHDGDGNHFVVGELVNTGAQTVTVEQVAGAVLDAEGLVRAAGRAAFWSEYLLPAGDAEGRERAPFSAWIYGPFKTYPALAVYPLAAEGTPREALAYQLTLTHRFVDSGGWYHLVGQLTNTGSVTASVEVLGGLYDAAGRVVDAYKLYTPLAAGPGESVPFDLAGFEAVAHLDSLADQVATCRLLVNPGGILTWRNVYALPTRNLRLVEKQAGGSWHFAGGVDNTRGKPISSAKVVVALYDAEATLVGVGFASAYGSSGKIAAGSATKFDVYVQVDPALDASTLTYRAFAQTTD